MGALTVKPTFSVEKAHRTQLQLSKRIVFEDKLPKKIRFVGGVDVAYAKGKSIGVVTVLDYDSLELAESQTASCRTRFPYVPTLLSFREIPPTILCIRKLRLKPDVFLVDGHGFAHPYRCGFASHLGIVMSEPTIGVAKGKLFGEVRGDKVKKGLMFLKHNSRVIGAAVTTKQGCKPVYVSVGHMVSLKTAIKIIKHCARGKRIPEPIFKAHKIATEEKIGISSRASKSL